MRIRFCTIILIVGSLLQCKNLSARNWTFENVDTYNSVGKYTSLALDKDGFPHISYYDETNKNLKYSYKNINGWHIETVDNSGDVGLWTSIVLDSLGFPHISYYSESAFDLKYAFKDQLGWHVSTIDSYGDVGIRSSIAIDNSSGIHISYFDNTNDDLKYAYNDGTGFKIQTVSSFKDVGEWSAISCDAQNKPHIVCLLDEGTYSYPTQSVFYAHFNGSSWVIEYPFSTGNTYTFIEWLDIELDQYGLPHVCFTYRHRLHNYFDKIMYLQKVGDSWIQEVVRSERGGQNYSACMALDSNDIPYICYYYSSGGYHLRLSYKSYGVWTEEVINSSSYNQYIGYVSMKLDTRDQIHISGYDFGNKDLLLARPQSYGPGPFHLISPTNGAWATSSPTFDRFPSSYQGAGLSEYELYIENNLTIENIPPTIYSTTLNNFLSDGWYTWRVKAIELNGNEIWSTETWSFRVDASPPNNFDLLSPLNNSWSNYMKPVLTWQSSNDAGSGLLKYQLFVDGSLNRDDISPTVTSTTPSWNLPDGDHAWYIVAADNAQNKTQSNQTWTIKIDTTPPNNFLLSSPANNSWTGDATPIFSWNSTTDNGIGLSKYQLIIDGGVVIDSISTQMTSVTLNPSQALINGNHFWKIKAFDLLGNAIETTQWTLKVDLTPPNSFSLSSPVDSGAANFPTPNFSWNATTDGGSGLSHYQLWIDNNLNIDNLTTTTTAPSAPLSEGSHQWFVKAIDNVGNERTSQQRTIFCDWTAPAVFDLVSPANGSVVMVAQPTLSWQPSNDAISGLKKYQLWINGLLNRDNIAASNNSAAPVNSLANGTYTWFIKAFDKADNSISSTSTWQFTVNRDVTAPSSVITSPSNNAVVGGDSVIVIGTATDGTGSGVQKVEVSTNGGASWSLAVNTGTNFSAWQHIWRGYTSGTYTIKSRATDIAENIETPSPGVTVTVSLAKPAVQTIEVLPPYAKTGQVTIKVVFQPNASAMDNSVSPTVTFKPAGSTTSETVIQQSYSGNTWIGIGNVTQTMNNGNATIAVSGAQNSLGNVMAVNTNAGQFVIDTTPPSSAITFPASGANISSATITITGTSTDAIGVDSVQISTDGGQTWKLTTNTGINFSTWSYEWAGYVNGNYILKNRAFDKALNVEIPGVGVPVTVHITSVSEQKQAGIPTDFGLSQNHPNPFNPETTIAYQLPISCHVELKIYNTIGQEIRTLVDDERNAGYHQIIWEGKDNLGRKVGTGIFLYQLKAHDVVAVKKMIMIQ